jgi:predicted transposase/invertase (TIGR01784 family)
MKSKYLNPFTDFGFKKLFGEEASKPLLMDFLNTLLPTQNQIKTLSFKSTEQLGLSSADRKAIYDVYCENDKGEKFIVELQKAKQNYFKDRTVFYSTFPIQEQAEKGEWNYKLSAVFCIGILDFCFDDSESKASQEVLHTVKLKDQNGKVFYDKLTYLYLEMPHFQKTPNELVTRQDKWLYFFKHLEEFEQIPEMFKDAVFEQAFDKASLATMNHEEYLRYEQSLKVYRDLKGVIDTAYDEGLEEGRAEGRAEGERNARFCTAERMLAKGADWDFITEITGVSADAFESWLRS